MLETVSLLFVSHLTMNIFCFWAVLCRLNHMTKRTRRQVFLEYFLLGLILLTGFFIPSNPVIVISLLFLTAWFLITAPRWHEGQPPDTLTPPKTLV